MRLWHGTSQATTVWLAVADGFQGQGIGTSLIAALEERLRAAGKPSVLQVKTLAETVEYEPYVRTRRFHERVGFLPLEIIPTLWSKDNPAKIYVKFIAV